MAQEVGGSNPLIHPIFSTMDYFVYILYFPDTGKSYVGHTDNIILRYYRHKNKQSTYTSRFDDPYLVYWEGHKTRSEAMKREKYFKSPRGIKRKKSIIAKFAERWL
jgi:putative endonuclease